VGVDRHVETNAAYGTSKTRADNTRHRLHPNGLRLALHLRRVEGLSENSVSIRRTEMDYGGE
jgi:hypothetical protein